MLLYRRGAQLFQKSRSHPTILGVRTVTQRAFDTKYTRLLGATVKKNGCRDDLALRICAILLQRTKGDSASTSGSVERVFLEEPHAFGEIK